MLDSSFLLWSVSSVGLGDCALCSDRIALPEAFPMGVSISWTFFLDLYCIYQVSVYTLQDNTMSKLIVSCKKCSALLILLLSEAANYSCMRGIHSPFTDAQLEMIATQIAQFRFARRRAENIKLLDSHFLVQFVCLHVEMLAGWTN